MMPTTSQLFVQDRVNGLSPALWLAQQLGALQSAQPALVERAVGAVDPLIMAQFRDVAERPPVAK